MNQVAEKPANQSSTAEASQTQKKPQKFFSGIDRIGKRVMGGIGIDITRPEAQATVPPEFTEIPVATAQAALSQQPPASEDEVHVVPSTPPEASKDEPAAELDEPPVIVPAVEPASTIPEGIQKSLEDVQLDPTKPAEEIPSQATNSFMADASLGRQRTGSSLSQMTPEEAIKPEEKIIDNQPLNPAPQTEPEIPLEPTAQVDQGLDNLSKVEAAGDAPVEPLSSEDRAVFLANLQELFLPDGNIDKEKFYKMLQEKKDEAEVARLEQDPIKKNTVQSIRSIGFDIDKEMVDAIKNLKITA